MMIGTALRLAVVTSLVVGAATPAFAQRREMQQMAADIRILQEQTQLLQNALMGLTDALKAVNARIDEQTGLTRKGFADPEAAVRRDRQRPARRPRAGRRHQRAHQVAVAGGRGAAAGHSADGRDAAPAPSDPAAAGATGAPVDPSTGTPPSCRAVPRPADHGRCRRSGCTIRPGPTTPPATTTWRSRASSSYVRSFPRTEFADDAQFYIGESYFQRGKLPRRSTPSRG